MSAIADFSEQWEAFEKNFASGRMAHAFMVIGSPRGVGTAFALAALRLLFGAKNEADPVAQRLLHRAHPDVIWIEPQSKSRVIRVDEIRLLNTRIHQTAMEGDWKVGILVGADRLNEQASNAFLKTLEEPSGQTLLLLLTDAPHALLPTIRSRCQQVVLSRKGDGLSGEWLDRVLHIARSHKGRDPLDVLFLSEELKGLLDDVKKVAGDSIEQREDEDDAQYDARVQAQVLGVRKLIMETLLAWQRDVLYCVLDGEEAAHLNFPDERAILLEQARLLSYEAAMRRLSAVEDMARRLERNLPANLVFDAGFGQGIPRRRKTA